jgi:hypothetical protein
MTVGAVPAVMIESGQALASRRKVEAAWSRRVPDGKGQLQRDCGGQ